MNLDYRRFEHTQHLVIVEIFLLYAAVFEGDFGFQGGGEAEDDAAFHLRFDDIGIDDAAAVYGADDAVNFDVAVFLYAGFNDLRDIGFKRKVSGDSACDSFGKRLPPAGFFRGQVEDSQHAGLFCEQLAAQFVGIFFPCVSDFIEKGFHGKTGVRMAYRAPPLHRYADFWCVEIDLKIGNSVENIGGAFDGSAVHAILDGHGFESGSGHDGLADDGVRPGDGIAFSIEACGKTVVPFRTIPAAGEIIFARPDNFHRSFGHFRDVYGFDDKVRGGIGATAKATAEERGVYSYLFRRQAGDFRSGGAIHGFELRAGPEFAAIGAKIHNAVERLHHGVREVGDVVFGGDGFCGTGESALRIAIFSGDVTPDSRRSWRILRSFLTWRGRRFPRRPI